MKAASNPQSKQRRDFLRAQRKMQKTSVRPKFKLGDMVVYADDPIRGGEVSFIGEYDDHLGGYRYKVLEADGTRHWWNETTMKKAKKAKKAKKSNPDRAGRRMKTASNPAPKRPSGKRYDATEEAIEAYVKAEADADLAMRLSELGDEDLNELDRLGWASQSAVAVAKVGAEEAVNGEILVPRYYEEQLGIQKDVRHPVRWSQAKFDTPLWKWLKAQGYEKTERGGAWPSDSSHEIERSSMAARLGGTPEERAWIQTVTDELIDRGRLSGGRKLIYGPQSDGKIEIYAKRTATDFSRSANPAKPRAKPRTRTKKIVDFCGYTLHIDDGHLTVEREAIDTSTPGDYGYDLHGQPDQGGLYHMFKMVPSGDVVDAAERDRRLSSRKARSGNPRHRELADRLARGGD